MKSVQVREALPNDAEAIVDILFRSWCATYIPLNVSESSIVSSFGDLKKKEIVFAEYLRTRDTASSVALVAECDGVLLGLCFAHKNNSVWKLTQLYIDPTRIGTGIGSMLITEIFKQIDADIKLSVVVNNERAINFYKSHGFVATGEKTVFHLGDDVSMEEIVMCRSRL